jgi:hypothetical protein
MPFNTVLQLSKQTTCTVMDSKLCFLLLWHFPPSVPVHNTWCSDIILNILGLINAIGPLQSALHLLLAPFASIFGRCHLNQWKWCTEFTHREQMTGRTSQKQAVTCACVSSEQTGGYLWIWYTDHSKPCSARTEIYFYILTKLMLFLPEQSCSHSSWLYF